LASRTRGLWSRTTCPSTKTSLHATSSRRCTDDLLKYLANERVSPPISALPLGLQRDIRVFFGSYSNACRLADDLLFRAGSAEAVDEACRRSAVGKLLPTALYVHCIALEALDPLLRVYDGCARAYIGTLDGANLIKLEAIPVSLGIFYVFKDGTLQQQYLANRYRLRAATPQKRISEFALKSTVICRNPLSRPSPS
jgi:hypothetical protein